MLVTRRSPANWLAVLLAVTALALAGCTGGTSTKKTAANTLDVLTCRASPGQQGPDDPPARLVNGVDGFIGDTNAYDSLPTQEVDGRRYLVWKSALAVAPLGLTYRTVSVVTPASARIGYGPLNPSRRVRFPACGHHYTLYTGGIFVRRAACVVLAVSGPGAKRETVTVPVLVAGC